MNTEERSEEAGCRVAEHRGAKPGVTNVRRQELRCRDDEDGVCETGERFSQDGEPRRNGRMACVTDKRFVECDVRVSTRRNPFQTLVIYEMYVMSRVDASGH